jgi:hypothetical protein
LGVVTLFVVAAACGDHGGTGASPAKTVGARTTCSTPPGYPRIPPPATMPPPSRLASERTFIQHGPDPEVILAPPPADARPAVPAEQAWSSVGLPEGGTAYELTLALFTSRLPAKELSGGTLQPIHDDELAWVAIGHDMPTYPTSHTGGQPPAPPDPCAKIPISLTAVDARTGVQIGGYGFTRSN